MTVYKMGENRIRITLTDKEVLSFFGEYESLTSVSIDTKLTVGLILRESLKDYESYFDGDLIVEIKARKYAGCIITVSSAEKRRKEDRLETTFEFLNTEALIEGVRILYKHKFKIKESVLYKINSVYFLIVTLNRHNDLLFMNEFCNKQTGSPIFIEHIKEYGKLICKENVIEKMGGAFIGF